MYRHPGCPVAIALTRAREEHSRPTTAPDVYAVILPTHEFRWVAIQAFAAGAVSVSIAAAGPDALIAHVQRVAR